MEGCEEGNRNVQIMICAPATFSTLQATWNRLLWHFFPRRENPAKKQHGQHSSQLTKPKVYYSLYKSTRNCGHTFTLLKL